LSYCRTWLVDGTFKAAPRLFKQLYTIHGLYNGTVAVPFVYAYLPGKSEEIHNEFFNIIKVKIDGEPEVIISDFEMAAVKACMSVFPSTELNGCLFHLTQNVFKHVQGNPDVLAR